MAVEEEECPHGLGDPAWCVMCNGRAEREANRVTIRYTFIARESRFLNNASCDHFVAAGESIACLSNGRYVCRGCAEDFE